MRPLVRLVTPDGITVELGPGDLIGRVGNAALVLDDPRVSEAHAMVSLRRGELYLLSLRRLVRHQGKSSSEVLLAAGVTVELAEGLPLRVLSVSKPARVRALRAPGMGVRPLGQVASVVQGPPLRLMGRFVPGAAAHVWGNGADEWRVRLGDGVPHRLEVGQSFEVDGVQFQMCAVDLELMGHDPTQGHAAAPAPPLRIVAHYESVEIHRPDAPPLLIGGIGARLVSELVAFGGPVGWEVLARELWRDEADQLELRHRWDAALGRLRARLREAGIRSDLVRSDGGGQLQLVLYENDRVDDRT